MRTQRDQVGCSIWDVDAKALPGPEMREVKNLLSRNQLIVLKDQASTNQEYCDFAGRFGLPVPYFKKEGRQSSVQRTGGYRQSDISFEQEPKVFTMLMRRVLLRVPPQSLPPGTRCIEMAEVYAALPRSTRMARWRRPHAQRTLALQGPF
jgi:alpha-ketoglutarate-dependent taurine dioxygenase